MEKNIVINKSAIRNIFAVIMAIFCVIAITIGGVFLNYHENKGIALKEKNETLQLCQQEFNDFQNKINQELMTTGKLRIAVGDRVVNLVPERE